MGDNSPRHGVGRFDSEEEFVPLVMFAGRRGAAAGEGLVEQLCTGDMIDLHPPPIGERTVA